MNEIEQIKNFVATITAVFEELDPKLSEVQKCITLGDPPPNSLMADICRLQAKVSGALIGFSSQMSEKDAEHAKHMHDVLTRAQEAYTNNDSTMIAIANAEMLGISINGVRNMIDMMQQMVGMLDSGFDFE